MGSYQKAPQKGITKLQYLLRGSFVLFLFQLIILINLSYINGYFYTAIRDLSTPQNPTIRLV